MDSLNENSTNFDELPTLEDGMLDIGAVSRKATENFLNGCMSDDADDFCKEHDTYRNGYRERGLHTTAGDLVLKIPKTREGTYFPDYMLQRYSRSDTALRLAIQEIVINGVSTRKVDRIAEQMGVKNMSASTVSRLAKDLDICAKELQEKNLKDMRCPYLWLDATYLKVRKDGHIVSLAFVTAITTDMEGKRQVIGFDLFEQESEEVWTRFIRSLKKRGLCGVKLVTSDAFEGLINAIEKEFTGASWQRCIVHFIRNIADRAKNKAQRKAIQKILHMVFEESDSKSVRTHYKVATEAISRFSEKAADAMEEAEASIFTYLDFPKEHHKRIRTNNVQERTNREIKRRSRVISVFFSVQSVLRYLGAYLQEMDEDWQVRCWFRPESLQQLYEEYDEAHSTAETDKDFEKRAEGVIRLVLEEFGLYKESGKEAA